MCRDDQIGNLIIDFQIVFQLLSAKNKQKHFKSSLITRIKNLCKIVSIFLHKLAYFILYFLQHVSRLL